MHSDSGLKISDWYTRVATHDLADASSAIEKQEWAFLACPMAARNRCELPVRVQAASCGHVAISTFQFGRLIEIELHCAGCPARSSHPHVVFCLTFPWGSLVYLPLNNYAGSVEHLDQFLGGTATTGGVSFRSVPTIF